MRRSPRLDLCLRLSLFSSLNYVVEFPLPVMKSRTNRPNRPAYDKSDFCVAQVVSVAQQQHLALERREGGEGGTKVGLFQFLERRAFRDFGGIDSAQFDIIDEFCLPFHPPQKIQRVVARAPKQPGLKRARIGKRRNATEYGEPQLLVHVVSSIADYTSHVIHGTSAVRIE